MKSLRAPVGGMDVTYTFTLCWSEMLPEVVCLSTRVTTRKPCVLSSIGPFWVGLDTPAFAPHLKLNVILHCDWLVNLSTNFAKRFHSNFTFGPGMHVGDARALPWSAWCSTVGEVQWVARCTVYRCTVQCQTACTTVRHVQYV